MFAPLQGHKLVFCFFVLFCFGFFFSVIFQPKEGMGNEMIFRSVNLKIKHNCLTRRVYSDRKKARLHDFSNFQFSQRIGFGPGDNTPGDRHIFKATHQGPLAPAL